MARFPFLRRPLRLILYTCLLALTTTAALVFALQSHLDGLTMEQALDAYSFVGTLLQNGNLQQPLPQEVVQMLEDSDLVDQIDIRDTYSAKILDMKSIPDYMMTTDQVHQHYFAEATVVQQFFLSSGEQSSVQGYYVRIDRQWGAHTIGRPDISLSVYLGPNQEQYLLQPGQRIFFVGDFVVDYINKAVSTINTSCYSPEGLNALGMMGTSALRASGFLILPEGMTEEETEAYILQHMKDTGILGLYTTYCQLQNVATVHTTMDFNMLPYIAQNTIYITDGRALTPDDEGKKICLVSQNYSLRNRLNVGGTISIALGDGGYTLNGYESGYPSEYDADLVEYGEYEEYEIVGIYNQIGRDATDPLFLDHNDIFIPAKGTTAEPLAYQFSMRILGTDYDEFMSELAPVLAEQGFAPELVDSGWFNVEMNFQSMLVRRALMQACALAAFAAAVLLVVFLILYHFRYEFGLRRLLGAYHTEALGAYLSGFLFTTLPGAVLAVTASWVVYDRWLRDAMAESVAVPDTAACLALLCGWAVAELAVALVILLLMVRWNERRSLLRLVR